MDQSDMKVLRAVAGEAHTAVLVRLDDRRTSVITWGYYELILQSVQISI